MNKQNALCLATPMVWPFHVALQHLGNVTEVQQARTLIRILLIGIEVNVTVASLCAASALGVLKQTT